MPGATAPASPPAGGAAPQAAPQQPFQFNSNAPGSGAQTAGTNYAMQNLNNALNLSGQTTNFQQQQLGQQLQNNQSNVSQNLANRGLGNTTISQTMAQAPLQTYNMGMAQVGDLNAQRQMQAYGNLANAAMQGGNAINATQQPYSQTQYANQMSQMQQLQNMKNSSMQGGVAAQNAMGMQPFGPQSPSQQSAQQAQQQGQQNQNPGQQASLYDPGNSAAMGNSGGGMTPQQQAQMAQYGWLMNSTPGDQAQMYSQDQQAAYGGD